MGISHFIPPQVFFLAHLLYPPTQPPYTDTFHLILHTLVSPLKNQIDNERHFLEVVPTLRAVKIKY